MPLSFLTRIFGSRNERILRGYRATVMAINKLEDEISKLGDAELRAQTDLLRGQLAAGKTLDDILPRAFAVMREASKRVLKMRHFDVQLMGGIALHQGKISEMRTGEGKTLVATLPVYLNALSGKGVHVVTVNDYLARRDAEWMGRVYSFLGLSVGVNLSQMPREEKQAAYAADVTYGTNNEFGFDYLRDNMVQSLSDLTQRGLHYAIVDEVDSILIDEARTPLIISGQAEDHADLYIKLNGVAPLLTQQVGEADPRTGQGIISPGDYTVDEKSREVHLTDAGYEKAEHILSEMGLIPEGASLYDAGNINLLHHLLAALRARVLFIRDQHYVVQNNEIIIVDEFTGRMMIGRRWSDGLHQAVEAKEGVKIQSENQTLASITFQNYFRMYTKLAGMTGTADTEAYEFQNIYNLETLVLPPNKPSRRTDRNDQVFKTSQERYQAAVNDIKDCYERGQPVLVGTTSIENSELISRMLDKIKLPHRVLNAKQHAKEAEIVAQAGRPKSITIATNMAGRGTDIVLGGNVEKQCELIEADAEIAPDDKSARIAKLHAEWESLNKQVLEAGGLHIVGTERHESRRIDNQLRGRAGRQGDPGSSRFYLSLDDALMRIFAGARVKSIMDRLKIPEGEAIEAGMVSRSIESAQRKVEARNFDIRKQLLEYDDVANEQRKVIYQQRREILESTQPKELITRLRESCFTDLVHAYVPPGTVEEQWNMPGLEKDLRDNWQVELDLVNWLQGLSTADENVIVARVLEATNRIYADKVAQVGEDQFAGFERAVLLLMFDQHWREHLSSLDYLRQGIHLRGYAQKNPKQEYKREAFELFGMLLENIKNTVTRQLMLVRVHSQSEAEHAAVQAAEQNRITRMNFDHPDANKEASGAEPAAAQPIKNAPVQRNMPKVGRNEPCPCGSGKKYKNCHGALT